MLYPVSETQDLVSVRRLGFNNKTLTPIDIVLKDGVINQSLSIGDVVITYFKIDKELDLDVSNKEPAVSVCAGKVIRPLQRNTPLIKHPINPAKVLKDIEGKYPDLIKWIKFEVDNLPSL